MSWLNDLDKQQLKAVLDLYVEGKCTMQDIEDIEEMMLCAHEGDDPNVQDELANNPNLWDFS